MALGSGGAVSLQPLYPPCLMGFVCGNHCAQYCRLFSHPLVTYTHVARLTPPFFLRTLSTPDPNPYLSPRARPSPHMPWPSAILPPRCLTLHCLTVTPLLAVALPPLLALRNWDGMYVLFTYAAKRQTARNVQHLLSNPEAGREDDVLRHITFCRL